MNGLTKFVTVLAKILEVCAWVGSALVAISLALIATGKLDLLKYLSDVQKAEELTVAGLNIDMATVAPESVTRAFVVFFITTLIVFILGALVFRNIYLIFKTAEGKTKFSKGNTPFQPDIIRMIREIGYFSLAIPVVQVIMGIIARLVLVTSQEPEIAVSLDLTSIFFGLVVLCLSQFFAYGAKLQEETEGLV